VSDVTLCLRRVAGWRSGFKQSPNNQPNKVQRVLAIARAVSLSIRQTA